MKEADPLLVTPVKQTKAASELGLSDDDLDNIDAALEAGKVGKSEKVRKKNKKKVTPKKKTQKVSQKEKKAGKKQEMGKTKQTCTFRHRKTSVAYHKEKAKYKRLGYSPTTYKKMAS